jgi:hypothetical protein
MQSPDNDKFYGYLSNFDQDKNIQYREGTFSVIF